MGNTVYKAKDIIFTEGAPADCMYIVKSGKVGVYAKYGTTDENKLATIGAGKFFGEMGIIDKSPRSATVVAEKKSELIEIKAENFDNFVQSNPADVIAMMTELSKRLRKTTKLFCEALRDIEYFVGEDISGGVNKQILAELAEESKIVNKRIGNFKQTPVKSEYKAGEVIFKQGEKASNLFKVFKGEVAFYKNYGKATQIELASVGKGAIFGEMAVIEDERRSATAVAKTDVELLSVAQSGFETYIEAQPEDAIKILRNITDKLRKTTADYIAALAKVAAYIIEAEKLNLDVTGYGIYKYADLYRNNYYSDGFFYDFYTFRHY